MMKSAVEVSKWNTNLIKYFFPEVTNHKSERCPPNGTIIKKYREILLHIVFVPYISEFTLAGLLIWDRSAYNCQKLVITPWSLELSGPAIHFFATLYSLPWHRFSRVISCGYQSLLEGAGLSLLKESLSWDKTGLLLQIAKRSLHSNSNVTQTKISINNRFPQK